MQSKHILVSTLCLTLGAVVSGCGGGGSDGPAETELVSIGGSCPPGGFGDRPDACCTGGGGLECGTAGSTLVAGAQGQGAQALNSMKSGSSVAAAMVDDKDAALTQGAATAGGFARTGLTDAAEALRAGAGNSSKGSGSASSGGGGGLSLSGGSITTATIEPTAKVDESSLGKAGKDSAYGSGSGGGGAGSDPFRGLASLGGSDGSMGAGGSSQLQLGGRAGANPIGSLDPSNYFAIAGDRPIFTRINQVYARTHENWSLQNAIRQTKQ